MKQYQDLVTRVRTDGDIMENRTGVNTVKVAGEMLKVNLQHGFPMLTCKKMHYKAAVNETFGFFRGFTSAAQFRSLGVNVWNANANKDGVKPNAWLSNPFRLGEDELGSIYGDQWRNWPGFKVLDGAWSVENYEQHKAQVKKLTNDGWTHFADTKDGKEIYHKSIDQVANCVKTIIENPTDRRIIFHAWNPAELGMMALPPCHTLYQFFPNPDKKVLDMCLYIRSNDLGLGLPFNMIGAATIVASVAKVTGYQPRHLTIFIGDAHVYVDQFEYLDEMMTKDPLHKPTFRWADTVPGEEVFGPENPNWVKNAIEWLSVLTADDLIIENYQHHTLDTPVPEMAV